LFIKKLIFKIHSATNVLIIMVVVYVTGKVENWALCTMTGHCAQCPISMGKVGIR